MIKILLALTFLIAAGIVAVIYLPDISNVQPPQVSSENKQVRIGILSQKNNPSYETSIAQMKQKLELMGYTPTYIQQDIDDTDQFPQAAEQLVQQNVNAIVSNSTPATIAAMDATDTIPIIFGSVGDPIENGIVKSLDSSDRNVTGISSLNTEMAATRLKILVESFPNIRTVYVVHHAGETSSENSRKKIITAAEELGVKLMEKPASSSADVMNISLSLRAREAQAIITTASGLIGANSHTLIDAQNREKIPFVGIDNSAAEKGAFLTYGPDYAIMGDQLASLLDQVLKGVKPQYLPIQRPDKIHLVVNRRVGREINLSIPEDLLSRAARIID